MPGDERLDDGGLARIFGRAACDLNGGGVIVLPVVIANGRAGGGDELECGILHGAGDAAGGERRPEAAGQNLPGCGARDDEAPDEDVIAAFDAGAGGDIKLAGSVDDGGGIVRMGAGTELGEVVFAVAVGITSFAAGLVIIDLA
jgi:hypothetical protein